MTAAIDAAAEKAGRDPSDIRRLYNVSPKLGAEDLVRVADEQGTSTFILMTDEVEGIKRFANEVAPRVREFAGLSLERAEDAVARVAQARADVAALVELAVDRRGPDGHLGVRGLDGGESLRARRRGRSARAAARPPGAGGPARGRRCRRSRASGRAGTRRRRRAPPAGARSSRAASAPPRRAAFRDARRARRAAGAGSPRPSRARRAAPARPRSPSAAGGRRSPRAASRTGTSVSGSSRAASTARIAEAS